MNGPYVVTWIDAYCPEDEWHDPGDFVIEKRVMRSSGWVLQQDREYMVLAGTYDEDSGLCTQVISIPRCCIMMVRDGNGGNTPTNGDSDMGDSTDLHSTSGDDPEEVEGLHSLVGVPDPGDFGHELRDSVGRTSDLLDCRCPCHHPSYGHREHDAPCCPAHALRQKVSEL